MFAIFHVDKHAAMLNMTTTVAVEIKTLPDWDVDWNNTAPQCGPVTLGISDLLPGNGDGIMQGAS